VANPPRYRPFRALAWGIFLTVALGFVALIVIAVVKGVMAERAQALSFAEEPRSAADCARGLASVYVSVHQELDTQRSGTASEDEAAAARWSAIRARLTALRAKCPIQSGSSDPLSRAYQQVQALQRLAESAATQYRQEVGPTDLEARRLLGAAGIHLQP